MTEAIAQYMQNLSEGMQYFYTFLISLIPVIELRGAIPVGLGLGLNWLAVYLIAVIANMLPVPFVILFARTIVNYLKKTKVLGWFANFLERHTQKKVETVIRYEKWALFVFVMIPLPGTGAWTGALIASFLDLRLKNAVFPIFMGVLVAGAIVTAISMGVFSIF